MSAVIWTNSLVEGNVATDEDDKPMLLKYVDELSRIVDPQGRKLEDFIDDTEAKAIVSDDYQGFDDGWELIKHRAKWHRADDGLALVRHLFAQLDTMAASVRIPAAHSAVLKEELSRCEQFLGQIKADDRFNFAVVM